MENRIHGFDLLRGACAMAVAFYHLFLWQGLYELGHLGLFSVKIFFVLSGASMYVAYAGKLAAGMNYGTFIGRRLFRLAPLYWLLVLMKGALYWIMVSRGASFEREPQILLNLTFLFGFANPGATSMLTGGWSLGIEFVFYCLFPFMLALAGRRWLFACAAMALLLWLQMTFAGSVIRQQGDMGEHWANYVQFTSFVAYFFGGCLIGRLMQHPFRLAPASGWLAFTAAAALLAWLVARADDMAVTGPYGAFLALLAMLVVWLSGHLHVPARAVWLAAALGNMSYGLYLLHPNIYGVLTRPDMLASENPAFAIGATLILSVVLALLLEHFYERRVRRFGYALLSRKAGN